MSNLSKVVHIIQSVKVSKMSKMSKVSGVSNIRVKEIMIFAKFVEGLQTDRYTYRQSCVISRVASQLKMRLPLDFCKYIYMLLDSLNLKLSKIN